MKLSIIKISPSCAAALCAALLGVLSCAKQEATPTEPVLEVVPRADVSMSVGGDDGTTKASVSGGYLYWQTGDKLVMASGGQINGTLTCTSVDGSGHATFSGVISNFTPASVNIYYLGNREADSMTPSFDFSLQSGTLNKISSYVFLKQTGVTLTKGSGDVYAPEGTLSFSGMTSLLTLTLNPAGSPGAAGAIATSAKIIGMKNCLTVNLADGTITSSYVKALDGTTDVTSTSVSPYYWVECSNTYYLGVIPQNAENLTMQVSYLKSDASTETTMWSNINWDMSAKAGKALSTNWTGSGKTPTIVESSQKGGYGGQAVEGGENADGQNHKYGYDGANVGDEADSQYGGKKGYGGAEVL